MNTVPKTGLHLLQCQGHSVTPTFMKIIHIHTCNHMHTPKHTHIFIFQQSNLQKAGRTAKQYKAVVSIIPN
jgi:hypothetical protein